ncbi:MAG: hypothetical protein LBF40_09090 [Deltaproteobacteria bacterium]|jgi:hypothetical protein|nr:hypothetical protein [Deltaproteobacteria bacterium]
MLWKTWGKDGGNMGEGGGNVWEIRGNYGESPKVMGNWDAGWIEKGKERHAREIN